MNWRIVPGLICAGVLGFAAYWSVRLGYADVLAHRPAVAEVQRAAALAPDNAEYRVRAARMLAAADRPEEAVSSLRAALALNPRDSYAWTVLGLRLENEGKLGEAERCLLTAARVDRQYDPRWALLNFYFRRGDEQNFWKWAKASGEMVYGDGVKLFELLWKSTQDDDRILNVAIPGKPEVLANYIWFLLSEDHTAAIERASQRLAAKARPDHRGVLLAACDRLIQRKQEEAALRIWDAMCLHKLTPYAAPAPEADRSLTNGKFETEPMQGFDWRIPEKLGVTVTRRPNMLRLSFAGNQREHCELMSQMVPVLPGRRYRVRYRYQTSGIGKRTGLQWTVRDPHTEAEVSGSVPQMASEAEKEEDMAFTTGPEMRFARLALWYRREPGTTRIEGTAWLSQVSLNLER